MFAKENGGRIHTIPKLPSSAAIPRLVSIGKSSPLIQAPVAGSSPARVSEKKSVKTEN
jgi:hypothetical protein